MSIENDENPALEHNDLVFILAIAGRIDAQSRILAQALDKDRTIYHLYAVLDSLSSSYSMFKYFFDVFISNNDTDAMHEMMLTPGGMVAIVAESLFLVTFSFLASRFENEKKDSFKKAIANAWPYFRDVMKGLKNAYKGWRSTVVAFSLIGGIDIQFLIVPVGIILGILAAANRFWIRQMLEKRKVMMKDNAELLLEIKKLISLSHEESESYLLQIKYQTLQTRRLAYLAVAAGGLIDGLYLYVGVLGLAVLSPQLLTAMAIICAFYTIACVITRIYEEYDFQLKLFITQTKCKLVLITKEAETSYAKLLFLTQKINKSPADLAEIRELEQSVSDLISRFEAERGILKQQSTRTYLAASLLGLKNGLYAYGALASILFLVGGILILTGTAFPPALLIGCVLAGLVFVVGFTAYSLIQNYQHLNKEEKSDERPYDQLMEMKSRIGAGDKVDLIEAESFHESLQDGLSLDPSPQYFFQEWFEVLRSLFSGVGKGQKFVDFAGNPLQELGEDGHYHDTPIMYVLAVFSALLFGAVLALRALARGLGRAPLGQVDLSTDIEQSIKTSETTEVSLPTEAPGESSQPAPLRPDSPPRTDTDKLPDPSPCLNPLPRYDASLSTFGLFETKSKKSADLRNRFTHSKSEGDLNNLALSPQNIIQGLA